MKTLLYEDELIAQFRLELGRATACALAMALVTPSGLQEILPQLCASLQRGATGRFLAGIDMPTHPDAIESLMRLQDEFSDQFDLRIFKSSKGRMFHPKFGVFSATGSRRTAIVGSSNLTSGGMKDNYEANLFTDDPKATRRLLDYFDEHFKGGHAKHVDGDWLRQYRRLWKKRELALAALRKARDSVRQINAVQSETNPAPKRIRGYTFAFTGGIRDWPRDLVLYPCVEKLGGKIARRAKSVRAAHCLVHGDTLGGWKTTQKLDQAAITGVPVISEEDFFRILATEKRSRRKRKTAQ